MMRPCSPDDLTISEPETAETSNNTLQHPSFPLGGSNYATVTKYANKAFVHIRHHIMMGNTSLPTKKGISLSPSLWQSLAKVIDNVNIPSYSGEITIVRNRLMVSTEFVNDVPYITLQRYIKRKDLSKTFLPSVCVLTEPEWDNLRSISREVTSAAICIMFQQILPELVLKSVKEQTPQPLLDIECTDAELALTTSLSELLNTHLQDGINRVFKCNGCELNLGNQLGHECVYMSLQSRMDLYGELALTSTNLNELASEFVSRNIRILNHITEVFIKNLNMMSVIETAKILYTSSDTNLSQLL